MHPYRTKAHSGRFVEARTPGAFRGVRLPPRVGYYLGIFDIAKNNESIQDVQHHTHGGIQTQPIPFAFQLKCV